MHPNIKTDIIIFEYIIWIINIVTRSKYQKILPINIEAFINDFRRQSNMMDES